MSTRVRAQFQRARQPLQIEQRRDAILTAALALFQEKGLEHVSLNDIAAEAGFAKSNIYRYFDSREHIYLIVLQSLAGRFEQCIYANLRAIRGRKTVAKVTAAVIDAYVANPDYGELITVVNAVLERQLSPALVISFRTAFAERRVRLAHALAEVLDIPAGRMLPFVIHIFLHVPGIWTFCFPRPDVKVLLDAPENRHLLLDFRREMTLFLGGVFGEAIGDRAEGAVMRLTGRVETRRKT